MTDWRIRFEPVITPVFRTWWRLRRPMTLGVRGIACDEAGRILLVRHTYAAGWHLPGGGVESGETALDAIVREMAEEGGVEAIDAPQLFGFYANHANFPNDHIAVYRFTTWRSVTPKADNEIAERSFFAPNDLPTSVTKGTLHRILELMADRPVSSTW